MYGTICIRNMHVRSNVYKNSTKIYMIYDMCIWRKHVVCNGCLKVEHARTGVVRVGGNTVRVAGASAGARVSQG